MRPDLGWNPPSIEALRVVAKRIPPVRSAHHWYARRQLERDVWGRADGIRMVVPGVFADRYLDRPYEPLGMAWLKGHLSRGSVALDVGAHLGFVTCLMARAVGPEGRVMALEPFPGNVSYIRRNLAANQLRAEVVEAAAGATTGRCELHVTGSSDSHGFFPHPLTDTRELLEVRRVRVADLLRRTDVVKMDTEGAECDVLEGMKHLLESTPALLVEWNPACQAAAGRRDDELVTTLVGLGYDVSVLDDRTGTRRPVEEVLSASRAGELPLDWYANLACSRRAAEAHAGV